MLFTKTKWKKLKAILTRYSSKILCYLHVYFCNSKNFIVRILLVFIFKLQKSRNEASVSANQLRDKLKDLKDKSDVIYNFNLNVLYEL